jgi:hypothetical protein
LCQPLGCPIDPRHCRDRPAEPAMRRHNHAQKRPAWRKAVPALFVDSTVLER